MGGACGKTPAPAGDGQERFPLRAGQVVPPGGSRASCLPDEWRWSVCSSCWVQPSVYSEQSNYDPPPGFPGWSEIEKTFKPPSIYNPPQLDATNAGPLFCYQINWLSHRSPICNPPSLPCCSCLKLCNCCMPGLYHADVAADLDSMLLKMLSVPPTSVAPLDLLGGVLWMDGNYAPEVFMTLDDANWISPSVGLKIGAYNWTHDETCFGGMMANGTAISYAPLLLRLEVSPNKKLIMLSIPGIKQAADNNLIWMYRPEEGEKFFKPDGSELQWAPGDWMRCTFQDPYDSTSPLTYQYMARRVAYMDADGTLVKTAAYEKFVVDEKMDLPHPNTCCNYGNCNLQPQQYLDNFSAQNRRQMVIYAQPPPGPFSVAPQAKRMP
ncbi:unnamed protein product [Polarella glacialis]|uniref:Uncharacterized protein n=1 Tax=Polarella glacialis TaxID=89957 RepID=A0A813E146_POLGL|nr:unnamed protein product [Polarella glacialis]